MVETCRIIAVYEEEAREDDGDNDDDDEDDEFELYFLDRNDFWHEQLYDRHGRPYISKKQRKRQAFKEGLECLTQDCKDL